MHNKTKNNHHQVQNKLTINRATYSDKHGQHQHCQHRQTIDRLQTDPGQFWLLWQTLEKKVHNYCLHSLTKNPDDAWDLCSETMLKAYEKLPDANPNSNILGWLLQLARHTHFDQLRKKQTQLNYQTAIVVAEIYQEDELFSQTFNHKIMLFIEKTLNNTTENYRLIAFDYFIYGKDYKQLSIEHHQSESYIRKLIFRARKQITPAIFKFINK
jgi:RNA polymerase sigma factor (sigma-70 family)